MVSTKLELPGDVRNSSSQALYKKVVEKKIFANFREKYFSRSR